MYYFPLMFEGYLIKFGRMWLYWYSEIALSQILSRIGTDRTKA